MKKASVLGFLIGTSMGSLQDNVDCATIAGGSDDTDQYDAPVEVEACGADVTKDTCVTQVETLGDDISLGDYACVQITFGCDSTPENAQC